MKFFKNSALLLLSVAFLTFSACEGTDEEPDFLEDIPGMLAGYDLHTLNPDVNDTHVVFKATLNTTDNRVGYGFMWYAPDALRAPEITTLPVGSGAHDGEFTLWVTDLPRNTELIVCSYVERIVDGELQQQIGEEIDFDWDF